METSRSADIQQIASNLQGLDNGQLQQQHQLQTPTVSMNADAQLPIHAVFSVQPQAHSAMQGTRGYAISPLTQNAPTAQHYIDAPLGAYSAQFMQQPRQNYTATQMDAMYVNSVPNTPVPSQRQQYIPAQVPISVSNNNRYGFQLPNSGGCQVPPGSAADYQFLPVSAGVSPAAVRANFSPADRNLKIHVPVLTTKDQDQHQGHAGGSRNINTQVQAAVQGVVQSAYGSLVNANIMNNPMGRDLHVNVHLHVHSTDPPKLAGMPMPIPLDATFTPEPCDPILKDPVLRAMVNFSAPTPPKTEQLNEEPFIIESSDDEELKEEPEGATHSCDEGTKPDIDQMVLGSDTSKPVLSDEEKIPAFQCETCQRVFNNKRGLDSHIKLQRCKRDTQANQQNAVVDKLSESSDHDVTNTLCSSPTQRTNAFYCSLCDEKLQNIMCLMGHLRKKHKLKIDHAEDTDTVMKQNEMELGASKQTAISDTKKTRSSGASKQVFKCPICDKGYALKIALMNHIRLGHKSSSYKTIFAESESKKTDTKTTNKDSAPSPGVSNRYGCSMCNKAWSSKSELTEHVKSHYTKNKNQLQSKLKDMSPIKSPEKEQETEIKHAGDIQSSSPGFRCEMCFDKSFRLRKALYVHMKKNHKLTPCDSDTDDHEIDQYPRSTSPNVRSLRGSGSTRPRDNQSTTRKGNQSTSFRDNASATSRNNRSTSPISCRSASPISSRSTTPISRRSSITLSETSRVESNPTPSSSSRMTANNTKRSRGRSIRSRVAMVNLNSPQKRVKYGEESSAVSANSSDVEGDLECNVCGYTFTHARELARHIKLEHESDNSSAGSDCEPEADTRVRVTRKERQRTSLKKSKKKNEKSVKARAKSCQHCEKEFHRESYLVKHESICSQALRLNSKRGNSLLERTTLTSSRLPRPCVADDYSADHVILGCSVKLQKIDIKNNVGDSKERDSHISCPHCSKPFTMKCNMLRHVEAVHGKKMTCLACKNDFTDKGALNIHLRVNHSKEFPFQCEFCYQRWRFKDRFKNHVKQHSKRENKYRCLVCQRSFLDKDTLNSHIRQFHDPALISGNETIETPSDEIVKFECHICKEYYSNPNNLHRHMMVLHNECVPKVCRHCKRSLNNKLTYMKHLAEKHEQLYPYGCLYCSRRFTGDKRQLFQRHKLSHKKTGKPYYCILCRYRFTTKHEYHTHISKHLKGKRSAIVRSSNTLDNEEQSEQFDQTGEQTSYSRKIHRGITNRKMKTGEHTTCMKDKGSVEAELFCHICKRVFVRQGFFIRHMKLHTRRNPRKKTQQTISQPEKYFEASETQNITQGNGPLNNKTENLSRNIGSSNPLSNSVCGIELSSPLSKLTHEATHWVKNEFQCEKCSYKCEDKIALDAHMASKHLEETKSSTSIAAFEANAQNESKSDMDKQDIVTSTSSDLTDDSACLPSIQSCDQPECAINSTLQVKKDQALSHSTESEQGSPCYTAVNKAKSDKSESTDLLSGNRKENGDVSSTNTVPIATGDSDCDFHDDSQDSPINDVLHSDNEITEASASLSSTEATDALVVDRVCHESDIAGMQNITFAKISNEEGSEEQHTFCFNTESTHVDSDDGSALQMLDSLITGTISAKGNSSQSGAPTAYSAKNLTNSNVGSDQERCSITNTAKLEPHETRQLTGNDEIVSEYSSHRPREVVSSKMYTSKNTVPGGDTSRSTDGPRETDVSSKHLDREATGTRKESKGKDAGMKFSTCRPEMVSESGDIAVSKTMPKTVEKTKAKRGRPKKSSSTTAAQDTTISLTTQDKPSSSTSQDAGQAPSSEDVVPAAVIDKGKGKGKMKAIQKRKTKRRKKNPSFAWLDSESDDDRSYDVTFEMFKMTYLQSESDRATRATPQSMKDVSEDQPGTEPETYYHSIETVEVIEGQQSQTGTETETYNYSPETVEVLEVGNVEVIEGQQSQPGREAETYHHSTLSVEKIPPSLEFEEIEAIVEADDVEVLQDVSNKNIFIRKVIHSEYSKSMHRKKKLTRTYNLFHACPFGCGGLRTNFSVHVKSVMHEEQEDMKKIRDADREESKRLINLLRMRADHEHNRRVIKDRQGEILLARKDIKTTVFDLKKYGPCPYCLSWLLLRFLRRHIPDCIALQGYPDKLWNGEVVVKSRILSGQLESIASQLLLREVFPIMKADTIGICAQSDDLIITLGNEWMVRNVGNKINRRYYTSQVMRIAARLKLALNKGKDEAKDLSSYITPEGFPLICKAVMAVSRQDEDNYEEFKAPSNAIRFKYDLKRLACIKLGEAITAKNEMRQRDAEAFLQLMDNKYCDNLAKVALFNKKSNERKHLPLPSDVQKLAAYLNKKMTEFDQVDITYDKYVRAVTLAQAKLISFNRRRCGEVQQILLRSYYERTTGAEVISQSLLGEMTESEKHMLNTHDIIEIRVKKRKPVPVVVPPLVRDLLRYIVRNRENVGVDKENIYLFASRAFGVIRGYNSLNEMTREAALENPGRVTSTKFRKYFATLTQSFDLKEQELRQVLDHLGHTMNVHKVHFRQLGPSIERLQIAKMLMLHDSGLMKDFNGKRIEDIPLQDIVALVEKVDSDTDNEPGDQAVQPDDQALQPDDQALQPDDQALQPDDQALQPDDQALQPDDLSENEILDEEAFLPWDQEVNESDEEFDMPIDITKKRYNPTPKGDRKRDRQYMTPNEVVELKEIFEDYLLEGKTPSRKDIDDKLMLSKSAGGTLWRYDARKVQKRLSGMLYRKKTVPVNPCQ